MRLMASRSGGDRVVEQGFILIIQCQICAKQAIRCTEVLHGISRLYCHVDVKMEDHVEWIEAWQMFICATYEHALWPQEMVQHFRHKKHKTMKLRDAQQIRREAMQKYPDVIQDPSEWIHPSTTVTEIPHQNGFQCQVDPATCQAVRQTKAAMRVHCSELHNRMTHSERGRPSIAATRKAKVDGVALWREVKYFQRAFVQGPHSQYFEVRPRPRPEQHDATTPRDARVMRGMGRAIEDIIRAGDEAKANADRFLEEGSVDEANRWMDRTKWAQYLKGHQHETLLDLIEAPDPECEFVEAAIWSAMDGLGRISQQTVVRKPDCSCDSRPSAAKSGRRDMCRWWHIKIIRPSKRTFDRGSRC